MKSKDCAGIILAGGKGRQLGSLTAYFSKPSIYFGGDYRIIDFALNNCKNSRISNIGVLMQYFSNDLYDYLDRKKRNSEHFGKARILMSDRIPNHYRGTTDAIRKNIGFIEKIKPDNVLILHADCVYHMDYGKMLRFHKHSGADVTVAAVLTSEKAVHYHKQDDSFTDCKPMGVYILKWEKFKKYLINCESESPGGIETDIISKMREDGLNIVTYLFYGYWKEIGTIYDLWEANMDLLSDTPRFTMGGDWESYTSYGFDSLSFVSGRAKVNHSIIPENCSVFGNVSHSVISDSVLIGEGSEVTGCVVMPNAYIGDNVKISNAVIGPNAMIMDGTEIGSKDGISYFVDETICTEGVSLVAPWAFIDEGLVFRENSHIGITRSESAAPGINDKPRRMPYGSIACFGENA